ncbi:MAG TPA: ROK family transcriptional regulator [Terriglobales bacterium]|nr:ROK family transcriptional regulator [Terriglobales bacterium]
MSAEIDGPPGTPRLLRALNERSLLGHLRRDGPASRAQLARASGLSKVTVSLTMANLERAGLVRVAGATSPGRGRLAVLYEPDPTAGHVVGVDIGRAWVRCALADLAGTIVGRRDVPNRARSADSLVDTVAGLAHSVVAEAGLDRDRVVHTLIGSPGVFNPTGGRLQFASNLPGWGRAGLIEDLRRALGPSLDLENDANLAAIGEGAFGAGAGVGSFVFLTVGTGVGMGVVVNGRLHRGARGAAGEIAYLPLGGDGEPGAPRPSAPAANRRGLLEEATAADAVVRTAAALGMAHPRSAQAVFQAARRGDPAARRAVDLEGERLALAVAAVAAILDPELVVLGGGIGRNLDLLQDALVRRLHQVTPLRPAVVVSRLGDDAVLRGAIATALDLARELVYERRAGAV